MTGIEISRPDLSEAVSSPVLPFLIYKLSHNKKQECHNFNLIMFHIYIYIL